MSHKFVVRITRSAMSCSAVMFITACTQPVTVTSSVEIIQSIISESNAHNDVHYQLSSDTDYPCKVTLQESWEKDDLQWQHSYDFELTDIEPGTFVQAKQGRRAIVYGGFKIDELGAKKVFRKKRINNIRYRGELSDEDQMSILVEFDKAIALCEEEYSF